MHQLSWFDPSTAHGRAELTMTNCVHYDSVFTLFHSTPLGRRGKIVTPHGVIDTPCFMPVATSGAMKGIRHDDLVSLGADILLCNTYHLHVRPGESIVQEAGGLHSFIGWEKPIITDSGGFQVFSLRGISRIADEGVHFQSHLDGSALFIGPEESMRIQHTLGSDIILCFDHCPPSKADRAEQVAAVDRTLRWAVECKRVHERLKNQRNQKSQRKQGSDVDGALKRDQHHSSESSVSSDSLLFGIVQGGLERDLRQKCAEELIAIGFDGYAVGGLAVGETPEEMYDVLDFVCPILPADKPRYLMGVGRLEQLRAAVAKGIDMFDCVSPMREARHGTIYLSDASKLRMSGGVFSHDHSVIDAHSPSPLSRLHLKSYLRHLLSIGERYGETIACLQNIGVTLEMMKGLREHMEKTEAP